MKELKPKIWVESVIGGFYVYETYQTHVECPFCREDLIINHDFFFNKWDTDEPKFKCSKCKKEMEFVIKVKE